MSCGTCLLTNVHEYRTYTLEEFIKFIIIIKMGAGHLRLLKHPNTISFTEATVESVVLYTVNLSLTISDRGGSNTALLLGLYI